MQRRRPRISNGQHDYGTKRLAHYWPGAGQYHPYAFTIQLGMVAIRESQRIGPTFESTGRARGRRPEKAANGRIFFSNSCIDNEDRRPVTVASGCIWLVSINLISSCEFEIERAKFLAI